MKIIYNVDAITEPLTGIGRYALNLGQQLSQMAQTEQNDVDDIRLFSSNRWVNDLSTAAKSNEWIAKLRQFIPIKYTALKHYHRMRSRHLTKLTEGMNDRVFHSPNFILMPFDGPSVATFHDLSFVHYRDTQPSYRLKFLDKEIPKTLDQAKHIITPSEHVRQEIITHYNYPSERITATPLGVTDQFKPRSQYQCEATLLKSGLSYRQFILSVATNEPRKNLLRLLLAYQSLSCDLKQHYPLVLVGDSGWKNQQVKKLIEQLKQNGEVICTGYVNQTELSHLYASATLTAFPSLYEGFGLPIIESMASATPVLTSKHSAMEEVAAGHAKLVNPEDVDDIKCQLESALNDEQWREKVSQTGVIQAQQLTWNRCALQTIEAYNKSMY